MKFLSTIILVGFLTITMSNCHKCKGENPNARIINNGTSNASVQVKTSGGNTININNVASGTASAYASYAAGDVTFTITVSTVNYVKTVNVSQCYNYDIAIDASNNITVKVINRN